MSIWLEPQFSNFSWEKSHWRTNFVSNPGKIFTWIFEPKSWMFCVGWLFSDGSKSCLLKRDFARWTYLGGSAANHPLVSPAKELLSILVWTWRSCGKRFVGDFWTGRKGARLTPISSLLSYVFSATSWELTSTIRHQFESMMFLSLSVGYVIVPWRLITILSTHNSTVPWRAWRIFDTCSRLKSDVVLQGKTKHTYVSLE